MRMGFVGTGDITEAIVTGLSKTKFADTPILLSPRNASISAHLAERFANVTVGGDNQAVVDNADLVFLAVRPQIAEEVTRGLRFRADQHVVSVVAATTLEQVAGWIGVPVRLTQAIPLPFVATLNGATAIYPPDSEVAAIFSALGAAIEVESKAEYELLAVASALMGSYFGILETSTRWLEEKGLGYDSGRAYLNQMFAALADAGARAPEKTFETMRMGYSTKGGLNEQVFEDFRKGGGTKALTDALDGVFDRIRS